MSGDEAGALERLKRFLNKSPRIIREKNSAPFFYFSLAHRLQHRENLGLNLGNACRDSGTHCPSRNKRPAELGFHTPLRLDLTDEKDLARALSLSQSLR
jgi:hypothetical protein